MTSKRLLSNKKITLQTISISPALKDWIKRYINVKHKENPEDERYRSISAFYCHIMEEVLKMFENNKTFDDFDRLMDKEINDFFDKMSFKAFIPYVETEIKMNRYTNIDFNELPRIFLAMRKLFTRELTPYDEKSLRKVFERFKKRYLSTISKEMTLETFREKNSKQIVGIIEFIGHYDNLHYVNCKMLVASLGILGIKVNDFFFSKKVLDPYCRIKATTTDLLYRKDLAKRERMKLLKENLKFVINYERVVKDKDYYLWIKMAEDNDIVVNFQNKKARDKWINIIEEDLRKYGNKEEFLLCLLKFFEKLHWIHIENENGLEFQIRISKEKFKNEREFLLDSLSKYSEVSQYNENFYLE